MPAFQSQAPLVLCVGELADVDVAVAGLRPRRRHAERHQNAGARGGPRGPARSAREGARVRDHVIGRQHHQHRLGMPPRDVRRRVAHRHRGVAPLRLHQHATARQARGLAQRGGVVGGADQPHAIGVGDAPGAVQRGADQRLPAGHRQQRLRPVAAREGPEALAGASGHDDDVQVQRESS
jgi:hypothetical protein